MNKKIWVLSLSLLLGACSTATAPEKTTDHSAHVSTEAKEKTVPVSVQIIVDNEEVTGLSKELEVEEGTSVLDVLKENYDVKEKDGFVNAIEGYEQNEKENLWWMYSVNGEEADVGAADFDVSEKDAITWTLIKYE